MKSPRESWLIAMLLLTMNLVALAQLAVTQPATSRTTTSNVSAATPPAKESPAKPAAPQPISTWQATYLVRSTLMMLNDANRSGNYTVLRDLAAPEFQRENSAADLAQSFLDLRRRKFDLFAVSFSTPQFSPDPFVDSSGRVRLTGFFPTQPLQIKFDLTFESVDGQWKLFAISIATPEAPKQQSWLSPPPSSLPSKGKPFYNFHFVPQG